MNVIKKDGKKQKFILDKVKISIQNAMEASKSELNSSDLDIISKDIEKAIYELRSDNTSSYEIIGMTINILKRDGFKNVALEYIKNNLL